MTLTDAKIKEILGDKETYRKLKTIAFIRDEIRMLLRQIDKLQSESRMIEVDLINKNKIDPIDVMILAIAAEEYFVKEIEHRKKLTEEKV